MKRPLKVLLAAWMSVIFGALIILLILAPFIPPEPPSTLTFVYIAAGLFGGISILTIFGLFILGIWSEK